MSELTDRIEELEASIDEAEKAKEALANELGLIGQSWGTIIDKVKDRCGYYRAFNAVADRIGAHPRPGYVGDDGRVAIEVCNTIEARIRRATGSTYLHQSILELSLRLLDTGSCITEQEAAMLISLGKRIEDAG